MAVPSVIGVLRAVYPKTYPQASDRHLKFHGIRRRYSYPAAVCAVLRTCYKSKV